MEDNNNYSFVTDASMRELIKNLNEAGLTTKFCCSGISTDHYENGRVRSYTRGDIAFKTNFSPYDKRNEIIYYLAEAFGLEYRRVYNIRDNDNFCLTYLIIKSALNVSDLKSIYDSESDNTYIVDSRFAEYSKVIDQLSKYKWKSLNIAAEKIKAKGINNITAKDICLLAYKDTKAAEQIGALLRKRFLMEMKLNYKKEQILHIIDSDDRITTHNVILKKSKQKIDQPRYLGEINKSEGVFELTERIFKYASNKCKSIESGSKVSTLVFEV